MSLDHIKQCTMCRKLFESRSGLICDNCLDQIELDFVKIKEYLYENPGKISTHELAKAVEVPEKVITHLIREGRMEMHASLGDGLFCEVCRKPITSGTMCEKCKRELLSALNPEEKKAPAPPKEPQYSQKDSAKMHVDRRRD